MGVFLHAVVCRKQDTVDVQALVRQLAAKEQDKEFKNFPEENVVAECQGGISIQLNDYCLEPDGVAKTLSEKLEGPVLAFGIYDDECWYYWLYREGRELDKFSTVPDCMVETDDIEEREQWRGNAALLAEEFGCLEEPLYEYLQFWGDEDWKDPWEVMDFLEALGFVFEEEDEDFLEEPDEEEWDSVPETIHYTGRPPILPPYPSLGKSPVDLKADIEVDIRFVEWVRVRGEEGEQTFSRNELTSRQIVQLMDETLNGQYTYFAVDFLFQGEGVYVKRLKKKVYRPFHSTLVLHQGEGKMACLFFAGSSMSYYQLIGDFYAYYNIDIEKLRWIPVGGAMLSEYCVFEERNAIDKALCLLFADLENADNWLEKSSFWSAEIAWPGGVNNYNRRRREFGLLED